jgi:hypothetical protein
MFTAFLDANALVPVALADTILRTAEAGLFAPVWSSRVFALAARAVSDPVGVGRDPGTRTPAGRQSPPRDDLFTPPDRGPGPARHSAPTGRHARFVGIYPPANPRHGFWGDWQTVTQLLQGTVGTVCAAWIGGGDC